MVISLNPCVSSCCLHVGPPIQTKGSDPRWNHQPASSCWEGRGCWASHMNTESSGSTHFPTVTPKLQAAYSCSCLQEGKGRDGKWREREGREGKGKVKGRERKGAVYSP